MREKEKQTTELVRSDLNLEKWVIFTNRRQGKERTLTRTSQERTQQVKIGVVLRDGKPYTLTTADGKVFYALLKKWERAKKPENGPVAFSLRSLCRELGLSACAKIVKEIKERLLNLAQIPIRFIESYKSPDGENELTVAFTLLEQLEIFTRNFNQDHANNRYFALSRFKIHNTITKTILHKGMKPVRLDVIRRLRSDCAFILYRYLEPILFKKTKHEEDLLSIARICELEEGQPIYEIKQTLGKALEELQGKEFASGSISEAKIKQSNTPSKWKIVVKKGQQVDTRKMSVQTEEEAEEEEYQKALLEIKNLPQEEPGKLRDQAIENIKSSNQGTAGKFALNNLSIEIEMVRIFREERDKSNQRESEPKRNKYFSPSHTG